VLVVRAVHVGGVAAVAPIAREVEGKLLLELLGLLVAEDVFFAGGGRSLQRRAGGIVPDTL